MTNLFQPTQPRLSSIDLSQIGKEITRRVNQHCVELYTEGSRKHLGASVIGHECARYVWLAFRWAKKEMFDGRMLRLFDTGHEHEERIVKWLTGTGYNVCNVDPTTGQQFEFHDKDTFGHYGGSTDGLSLIVWNDFTYRFICEIKTHNQNRFTQLKKDKLRIAYPKHYAQMCQYGKRFGAEYGLYCAENKNDSELYFEAVELDPAYAEDLGSRAYDIIFATVPPQKCSMRPDYHTCRMCPFHGICWAGQSLEKNCRSCEFSRPVENSQWRCVGYDCILDPEFVKTGCDQYWSPILKG